MHWMSPIIVYWARRQSPDDLKSRARAYRDWLANPVTAEVQMAGADLLLAGVLFLFAAVVAVPLAARLGIGAVLGICWPVSPSAPGD
jgi:hypothetical protein